jgi:hypothetical protein
VGYVLSFLTGLAKMKNAILSSVRQTLRQVRGQRPIRSGPPQLGGKPALSGEPIVIISFVDRARFYVDTRSLAKIDQTRIQ